MSYSRGYLAQVKLLLQVLPIINQQDCFALKGGTAINLFIRDMLRLSVDIDLTYLPIEPREPRDLFDVKILLENEGITESVRQAFVVYLASNSRPIHELLNPTPMLHDTRKIFEESFSEMTKISISYEQLIKTRYDLIDMILKALTENERKFLLSIKEGNPCWELLPIGEIDKLPGLCWKNFNITKMDRAKHKVALEKLRKVLEL